MNWRTTRRRFIVSLGAGVAILGGSRYLQPWGSAPAALAEPNAPKGFLFLNEGDELPAAVRATGSPPVMEHTSRSPSRDLSDAPLLAKAAGVPIYTLDSPPGWLSPPRYTLTTNDNGQIYAATTSYQAVNPANGQLVTVVEVTTREIFLSPYPLFPSRIWDTLHPVEIVGFLPTPGVVVTSAIGFIYSWMTDGLLYELRAEFAGSRDEADALARNLVSVSPQ